MANVLMLLSNPYRPDPRVQREARVLASAGHNVTIAAWNRDGRTEDFYDGDIRISRLGPAKRQAGSFGFYRDLKEFWSNVFKKFSDGKWDIIHAHDLDTLEAGLRLGKKLGVPVVLDAHEIYSEMVRADVPSFVHKILAWYEKKVVRRADHIITVNDALATFYKHISKRGVDVVMNCPDGGTEKWSPPTSKTTRALYIGALEPGRKLEEIVSGTNKCPGVEVLIGGYGSLETKLRSMAAEQVLFLGEVPHREVSDISKEAHVLLGVYDPGVVNNRLGAPNKLFEAMAYGRPIIVSKGSWAGDIVEKEECGIAVDYIGDGVFEALRLLVKQPELVEKMGRAGLKAHTTKYNWNKSAETLLGVYDKLLSA